MGPIVTDLFNTGMKQYETDESLDASLSVYDDNQYELRFTSDDITAVMSSEVNLNSYWLSS